MAESEYNQVFEYQKRRQVRDDWRFGVLLESSGLIVVLEVTVGERRTLQLSTEIRSRVCVEQMLYCWRKSCWSLEKRESRTKTVSSQLICLPLTHCPSVFTHLHLTPHLRVLGVDLLGRIFRWRHSTRGASIVDGGRWYAYETRLDVSCKLRGRG